MFKKISLTLVLACTLASCGNTPEEPKPTPPAPVVAPIATGALGESNAGFTSDLNSIIEDAYNASSSGTTATGSTATGATLTGTTASGTTAN